MIKAIYTLACLALLPFLPFLLRVAGVPFGAVDNLGVILGVGFGINLDDMLASRMGRKANPLVAGCIAGGSVNLLTDFAGAWVDPSIRGAAWGILLGCALPMLLIPFLAWLKDWRDAKQRQSEIERDRRASEIYAKRARDLVCDICRVRADAGTVRDALGEWLCSRCRRDEYTNAGSLSIGDVVTVPALDPRTNKRDAEHGNPFVVVRLDPRSEYVPITLQGICDAPLKRFPVEVVEWTPRTHVERARVLAAVPGVLRAYDVPRKLYTFHVEHCEATGDYVFSSLDQDGENPLDSRTFDTLYEAMEEAGAAQGHYDIPGPDGIQCTTVCLGTDVDPFAWLRKNETDNPDDYNEEHLFPWEPHDC